jgi:hypothetical protein
LRANRNVAPRMAFLRRSCKNVPGGTDENQHESHDVALS